MPSILLSYSLSDWLVNCCDSCCLPPRLTASSSSLIVLQIRFYRNIFQSKDDLGMSTLRYKMAISGSLFFFMGHILACILYWSAVPFGQVRQPSWVSRGEIRHQASIENLKLRNIFTDLYVFSLREQQLSLHLRAFRRRSSISSDFLLCGTYALSTL